MPVELSGAYGVVIKRGEMAMTDSESMSALSLRDRSPEQNRTAI